MGNWINSSRRLEARYAAVQSPNGFGPCFRVQLAWYPIQLEGSDGKPIWMRFYAGRYFRRGVFYDLEWERRSLNDLWVKRVGVYIEDLGVIMWLPEGSQKMATLRVPG